MNILIVEDSRSLRISNERALARAGYQVIPAADGEEGLRLARQNKPDLVILDLMLPKLPGREVLRELRSRPETASISALIVSSLPPTTTRSSCENAQPHTSKKLACSGTRVPIHL
jgi:DNA-binding response OmpR family regulator